jgi:glycosyltransferase involved in cell wall biosynthesis
MFRGTGLLLISLVLALLRIPFGLELCGPPQCFLKKSHSLLRYPGDVFMLRNASVIIALTRELAELASEIKKADAVVSVTGVGVNSEDYQVIASAGETNSDGPVLGFLGTLYADRGLGNAIESVAELNKCGIKARLVVVGDGPYRGEAEQLTARLGIGSQVDFKGWIKPDKVSGILADCDLMLALYERSPEMTVGGINPMKVWTSLATGKANLLYNPGKFDAYSGVPGIFTCPNTVPADVAKLVADLWKRLGKKGFIQAGLEGRKYIEEKVTWLEHTRVIDQTIRQMITLS